MALLRGVAAVFLKGYAWLMGRPGLYRLNLLLLEGTYRAIGILNWDSDLLRGERALVKALLSRTSRPPVVVDVGAYVGDYVAMVLQASPDAEVYAFEPHPVSFQSLKTRFPAIHAYQAAVSSTVGKATLYDYGGEAGSEHASLVDGVFQNVHGAEPTAVEVDQISLGDFLVTNSVTRVDLLKIDVEGYELEVVKGLAPALADVEIRNIQIEFNEMNAISKVFLDDLTTLLEGYQVFRLLPGGRLLNITNERPMYREVFAYQNLLFAKDGPPPRRPLSR